MKPSYESNKLPVGPPDLKSTPVEFTLFPFGSPDTHGIALGFRSLKQVPESYTLTTSDFPSANPVPIDCQSRVHVLDEGITLRTMAESRMNSARLREVVMTDGIRALLANEKLSGEMIQSSEIEKLLGDMPRRFRAQALDKYQDGISTFGKVPVETVSFIAGDVRITGAPRPMGCPELPPEGSEFNLAWKEGALWDWELSPLLREISDPLNRTAKYLDVLRRLAESHEPLSKQLGKTLLSKIPSSEVVSEETDRATLQAFEAGIDFARLVLYREVDSVFNAARGRSAKSAWPDIIRHALVRHGLDISVNELAKKMGLQPYGSTGSPKEAWILKSAWPYVPGTLTVKEFRQKVSEVKKGFRDDAHSMRPQNVR